MKSFIVVVLVLLLAWAAIVFPWVGLILGIIAFYFVIISFGGTFWTGR